MFFSCQTEELEINQDSEQLSTEIKELSIYKLSVLVDNLVLNKNLSNLEKVKLKAFSQSILLDLKTFESNNSSKTTRGMNCTISSGCGNQYIQCTIWATYWENLLASCNGPINDTPNNCDQIREDYINNLDEIESTYNKCKRKLDRCIIRHCPEDDGGFGDPL